MNYTKVSIKDVRNNLSELIERVAFAKESFLVTKFGNPKALIISTDILEKNEAGKLAVLKKTAGLWSNRKDIKKTASWVRKTRAKDSSRYGKIFS